MCFDWGQEWCCYVWRICYKHPRGNSERGNFYSQCKGSLLFTYPTMMQGSRAWNWKSDKLCCHLIFLFVSFTSVTRWLSRWLPSIDGVLLFRLFIVLNGATDWSNIHLCHLTTPAAALVWLNLCDWVREPVLWHASKICPGERVIKGFGEEAVSKNENQCERTQHMQRFSGSPQPGS